MCTVTIQLGATFWIGRGSGATASTAQHFIGTPDADSISSALMVWFIGSKPFIPHVQDAALALRISRVVFRSCFFTTRPPVCNVKLLVLLRTRTRALIVVVDNPRCVAGEIAH
jgi:hypothetical protein